jgi:uncharacterized protein YciI
MQYLVAGILKAGSEAALQEQAAAFNEHLAQPFRRISLAAALRDEHGKRKGYVVVVEADSYADAEAYLHQSPHYIAGLYERVDVAELDVQLGAIV